MGRSTCSILCLIAFMVSMNVSAIAQQKHRKKHKYGVGHVVEAPPPVEQIFTSVVQPPEFPGGTTALNKYLHDNIKYPPQAKEDNVQGHVDVSFLVNEDGSTSDIMIDKGLGSACDRETIRVISNMPKWRPYKREGKAMKMLYQLRVEFRLTE